MASVNYTPATYSNGDLRDGTEQTDQETRIDAAIDALEGASYIAGQNVGANRADITTLQGEVSTLQTQMTSGADTGHTHSAATITSVPSHSHAAGEISGEPGTVFAGQSDFDDLAGPGWLSGGADASVKGNETDIATNVTNIAAGVTQANLMKDGSTGASWNSSMNLKAHDDQIAINVTDIATNLASIGTNATNISSNDTDIATNVANIATNAADIATNVTNIAAGVTQANLMKDGSTGASWNSSMNLKAHNDSIATNAGDIATNAADIATNVADIATNVTNISGNDTDIANLQGSGYTNDVEQPTNTTGVKTQYPTSNGSALGSQTLDFTLPGGVATLTWGGGPPKNVSTGGTFTLTDSGGKDIEVVVTVANLPGSPTSDSLEVFKENVHNNVLRLNALEGSSSLPVHNNLVHGNGLLTDVTVATAGDDQPAFSNIRANVAGTTIPGDGSTASLTPTISAGLAVDEARIDVVHIDTAGTVAVTEGTAFKIEGGIVSRPANPVNTVVVRYIWVAGDRTGIQIFDSDILTEGVVEDFIVRQSRLLDAGDWHGTGNDQRYGRTTDYPRTLTGIVPSVYRMFQAQQPTGASIDPDFVEILDYQDAGGNIPHFGVSTPGRYLLEYFTAGGPEGSFRWGGGSSIPILDNGILHLDDSNGNFITVDVTDKTKKPLSNVSENIDIGEAVPPPKGRYTLAYNSGGQTLAFDGGSAIDVSAGGYFVLPDLNSRYYLGVYVNALNLPASSVTDYVKIHDNGLTVLDMKLEQALQALGSGGAGAGAAGTSKEYFEIGNASTEGPQMVTFGDATESIALTGSTSGSTIPITGPELTRGFEKGQYVRIYDDNDTDGEIRQLIAVTDDTSLTTEIALVGSYTPAANAKVELLRGFVGQKVVRNLTATAAAAQKVVALASLTDRFKVGDIVKIVGELGAYEYGRIDSISPGVSITLEENLNNTYTVPGTNASPRVELIHTQSVDHILLAPGKSILSAITNDRDGFTHGVVDTYRYKMLQAENPAQLPWAVVTENGVDTLEIFDAAALGNGTISGNDFRQFLYVTSTYSATSALDKVTVFKIFRVPPDFVGHPTNGSDSLNRPSVVVKYQTSNSDPAESVCTVAIRKNGQALIYSLNGSSVTESTIEINHVFCPTRGTGASQLMPGDEFVVSVDMECRNNEWVKIFDISWEYARVIDV